ncbi:DUF1254 domain-containing protein [Leifsonia sp. NPDC058292]|uniref:DUF1254 domain-containing protein n=1 Tax=Leifsonia sp. NPDC058292 TaxID=3346428 RepID=UPI0036DA97D7
MPLIWCKLHAEGGFVAQFDLKQLAVDAYLFAYPLVMMDYTKRQMTNVPDAHTTLLRAPLNQFAHARDYPVADSKDVVRFNFDTLYSFAWLDVRAEPVVLSVPDGRGRYYLTPMLDMWTDIFAVPGTRTTQGEARDFLVTGPGWSGEVPDGLDVIAAPTPFVWVMGRTQANGVADFDNVHRVQDEYGIVPLSAWGSDYTPPTEVTTDPSVDDVTPPLEQVNALSGVDFFTLAAELLSANPPHPNDYPILHRMRALGIRPGQPFVAASLGSEEAAAIDAAPRAALADLARMMATASAGIVRNGWNWAQEFGTYGTSYRLRALVAMAGLGANLPEDAIYPNAFVDADGEAFDGSHNYVLHFEADGMPGAHAFWSLTMYDADGFQVPNPLDRFVLRDRDPLTVNPDGSLDIYIQHMSPGADKESNWLPAPQGAFSPMLRLYSPTAATLAGGFVPPAIRKR